MGSAIRKSVLPSTSNLNMPVGPNSSSRFKCCSLVLRWKINQNNLVLYDFQHSYLCVLSLLLKSDHHLEKQRVKFYVLASLRRPVCERFTQHKNLKSPSARMLDTITDMDQAKGKRKHFISP